MALRKLLETNFDMVSGDTKDLVVSVLDENDAVVPITGATATFVMSKTEFSPILFTYTVGSGIVITDGAGGILTVTIAAVDTEPLIGQHYYEIELVDASLKISTIALGRITIRKNQI